MARTTRSIGTDRFLNHANTMPTLSIIGCGKVGQTLAWLWRKQKTFQLLDVLNRSIDSAQQAVTFIGGGNAVNTYAELRSADVYLLAAVDDQIVSCCETLANNGKLHNSSIVFHCSGALSSLDLIAATQQGAAVASIHPIRSFAAPQQTIQHFAGTWCGSEGDVAALSVLKPAFLAIGAQTVDIKRDGKMLYHSAAVFASNYLVTLIDVAQRAYIEAGIPPDVALKLIASLQTSTMTNIFKLGPATALTGPIARGDRAIVNRQYQALQQWEQQAAELYKQFATLTMNLSTRNNDKSKTK